MQTINKLNLANSFDVTCEGLQKLSALSKLTDLDLTNCGLDNTDLQAVSLINSL